MSTVFRFTLIIGGSVAYLGLAVLGWGGFAAFFCRPAFIALSVVLFALSGLVPVQKLSNRPLIESNVG